MNPEIHSNIMYEYDNLGILQKTVFTGSSIIINSHYSFTDIDKYGNWQTLTITDIYNLTQVPSLQIVKRKITYYE